MDRREIYHLIESEPWEILRGRAEKILLENKGTFVQSRGLVEFSNICRRNCLYCGLRAQNRVLPRYLLSQDEICKAAGQAVQMGCDTIVLQSGEGSCDAHWLAEVVTQITRSLKVPVTLCVGEHPESHYDLWRKAGAQRYLLKHETADPALYGRLHPGYTLDARLNALKKLAFLDYQIGSGFMIGLPGQTVTSLVEDIFLCRELKVDMCGAGPFIAQADTPLAAEPSGTAELALRILSVLRIALPMANLPATTALASMDVENGQIRGLKAGANVLMPSFTPAKVVRNYQIYDHKNMVHVAEAARSIEMAGRVHSLKARWPRSILPLLF